LKKTLLTTAICILFVANGFTQNAYKINPNDERKSFVSVNLGLSIPTGNFGSKSFDNSESAYASTGFLFDVTYGYKISPNFGITAMWRNQANGIDTDKYKQDLEEYLDNHTNAFYPRAEIEAGSFKLNGIMVGLYTMLPVSKKTSFDTRVLLGYSLATTPSFSTVVYEYGTKSLTINRDRAETGAFSYVIGAGLKKTVSEKTYLMVNIDFYSAKAKWKNVKETAYSYRSGYYQTSKYDLSQQLNTVNISIGLGKRF
jgi:hypothetical protein